MRRRRTADEKPATQIIEEATELLRTIPASMHLLLLTGTVPFVLGFLYFVTDMSKGAAAGRGVAAGAFSMALLFIWMNIWKARFARALRYRLIGRAPEPMGTRGWIRVALLQSTWQAAGLVLLPVASLFAVPFGWTYAFFRNLMVLGDGEEAGFRPALGRAWLQAKLAQRQNHLILIILSFFGLFVYLNFMNLIQLGPYLLKTLLGIESVFTRSGGSFANTTLLAVSLGATYLVMEPLVSAIYTLRCFYGESLATGEDLKAELGHMRVRASATVVVLAMASLMMLTPHAALGSAGDTSVPAALSSGNTSGPEPGELDEAIESVLKQRRYQWRLPRVEEEKDEELGIIGRFFKAVSETVSSWLDSTFDLMRRAIRWVLDLLPDMRKPGPVGNRGSGWSISPDTLVLILLFAVAIVGSITAVRLFRQRGRRERPEKPVIESMPDIEDEGTTADELPPDQWMALASELLSKGEHRLAIRALYLACLARLADKGLISVAMYKTNRDYIGELGRRSHALPGLLPAFSANVRLFEMVWYGRHAAGPDMLGAFNENQRKVFAIAEPGTG